MRKITKIEWIAVAVALVAAGAFFSRNIWTGGSQAAPRNDAEGSALSEQNMNTEKQKNISTVEGLEIYDMEVGTGAEAKAGELVAVHYVGTLADGKKFDSSVDRGEPFVFQLGAGQVIQGWDLGVAGMKIGGVRQLTISPELGYGASGAGNAIPPNSTLIFMVQLLATQDPKTLPQE